VAEYRAKLKSLKEKTEKIYLRIREKDAFPAAIEDLKSTISLSKNVLQNITEILNVTEEERDRVLKIVTTTEDWVTAKVIEQAAVPAHKDPTVTSDEVLRKKSEIDMQARLLLRKPKRRPPPINKESTKATGEAQPGTEGENLNENDVKTERPEKNEETDIDTETTQEETDLPTPPHDEL